MHPDFVLELGRQYQAEAREEAALWRLARGIRRRRKQQNDEAPGERQRPCPADTTDSATPDAASHGSAEPQSHDKEPLPAG